MNKEGFHLGSISTTLSSFYIALMHATKGTLRE